MFMLPNASCKHHMKAQVNPFQPSVAVHQETGHLVCTTNMTGHSGKCNTRLKWLFSPVIAIPAHLQYKKSWLLKINLNFQEGKLSVAQKTCLSFVFCYFFYRFYCFMKYFLFLCYEKSSGAF